MSRVSIRVSSGPRISTEQLLTLRRCFGELADVSPAALRAGVAATPSFVVGAVEAHRAEDVVRELAEVGLAPEAFTNDDYTAEYVVRALPAPPAEWRTATARIEAVFRPSFHPDVVLRAWSDGASTTGIQLATLQASLWVTRFRRPEWLAALTDERRRVISRASASPTSRRDHRTPSEEPWQETRDGIAFGDLAERAMQIESPAKFLGLDGIFVTIRTTHSSRELERALWSPSEHTAPVAWRVLADLHRLSRAHLVDARSRRALEQLHGYLGLGPPFEDLGGAPRVVRCWGGLSGHDGDDLERVLASFRGSSAVLDLSDVEGIAGMLVSVLGAAAPGVRFVATGLVREMLVSGGLGARVHSTRAEAVAAAIER